MKFERDIDAMYTSFKLKANMHLKVQRIVYRTVDIDKPFKPLKGYETIYVEPKTALNKCQDCIAGFEVGQTKIIIPNQNFAF